MEIKGTIRKIISRIYHTINPQFKHILFIRGAITDLQDRIAFLESKIPMNVEVKETEVQIDKLFLASDISVYRYLYLLRYIKDNSTALDVEGEYGVGADLIAKYTPVESCLCINSIDYYTRTGGMYYSSDYVHFKTGTIYDISRKFDVITALNEKRTRLFNKEDVEKLYDLLEFGGMLAIALDNKSFLFKKLEIFLDTKFQMESKFYQNENSPELVEREGIKGIMILYLRKNG